MLSLQWEISKICSHLACCKATHREDSMPQLEGVSHLLISDPGVQHVIGCEHQASNLQEETEYSVRTMGACRGGLAPLLVACINQHYQYGLGTGCVPLQYAVCM